MRIGIDASNLRGGGGITHLIELLTAADATLDRFDRVVVWGGRTTLDRLPDRPWLQKINPAPLDGGFVSRARWKHFALDREAATECDLLFAPGGFYVGAFRPFVTMSRNMLPFDPPSAALYGWSLMRLRLAALTRLQTRTFRMANGTIFLTNVARQNVERITGPLRGLTRVVPHGVNDRYRMAPRPQRAIEAYSIERPFRLLYVSIVDVYKHQWVVADAVSRLRRAGMPVVLDLIGHAYPRALDNLRAAMREHDPKGETVYYLGDMPNQRLHEAYARADAFVFASSCENMPNILIEAMAAGLPIACSNRSVMPEVIGDAGLLFDPESADSAATAIGTLVGNAELRAALANTAYTGAMRYSWASCARQTFEFLHDVREAYGVSARGVA